MTPKRLLSITLLIVALAAPGCKAPAWQRPAFLGPTTPIVFTGPATMNDIVRVVNSNTAPVRQLHADGATVTIAGFPGIRANLDFERPRKFRMRTQAFVGTDVDLGSNDELFWFWSKYNPQPAVFYARHEQFARSPARQQLPIDPLWIPEALGLVQLDPAAKYEGPFPAGKNRLEFRARVTTPAGDQTRQYVLHDQYGWILEQHVYDARNQLLASARASRHRLYQPENITLPQQVDIQIPSQQLNLSLNVTNYQFNNLTGDTTLLWALPKFEGTPLVDLADPNVRMPPTGLATTPTMQPLPPTLPANMAPTTPPPTYNPNPSATPYSQPQPNYRLNQRGMPTTTR